jgi:hypothetical protein
VSGLFLKVRFFTSIYRIKDRDSLFDKTIFIPSVKRPVRKYELTRVGERCLSLYKTSTNISLNQFKISPEGFSAASDLFSWSPDFISARLDTAWKSLLSFARNDEGFDYWTDHEGNFFLLPVKSMVSNVF